MRKRFSRQPDHSSRRNAGRAARLLAAAAVVPSALHAPLAGYAAMSETAVQSVKAHIQAVLQETLGSRGSLLVGETVTLDLDDVLHDADGYRYVVTVQNPNVATVRASGGNLVIGGTRQGTTMVDVIATPTTSSLQHVHEYFRLQVDANAALDSDNNGYTVQDIVRYVRQHPELAGRKEAIRTLLAAAESFVAVPNRPPQGRGPVQLTVQKNGTVALYLHQFFSDADGDALTYEPVLPTTGRIADVAIDDGRMTVSGLTASAAPMTFTVRASDGVLGNALAAVTFAVTVTAGPNAAPVIADSGPASLDEGGTHLFPGSLVSDADTPDSGLTITFTDIPDHGTLTYGNAGTVITNGMEVSNAALTMSGFKYEHDGSETTSDSFTYQVSDGVHTAVGSYAFDVTPVNDVPKANPAVYTMNSNATLTVDAANGLLQYVDDDSVSLTAMTVTPPTSASLHLNPDGSFTFTPQTGMKGSFTFKYKVSDGEHYSDTQTVTVTVVDQPPALASIHDIVQFNGDDTTLTSHNLSYIDPDGSPYGVKYTLVSPPAHGTLELEGVALEPGSVFYQADIDSNKIAYWDDSDPSPVADSFTYTVTDGVTELNGTFDIRIHTIEQQGGANNDGHLYIRRGQQYAVDLREIFGDAENDLQYDIDETSFNMAIDFQLSGSIATFEGVEYPSGSTVDFELKASSNGGDAWMTHPVTVHLNPFEGGIPDQNFLSSNQLGIDLTDHFDLPGTDWTVEASDRQNGAYAVSGYDPGTKQLRLDRVENVTGRSTIDVTVRDNHGGYATDTFAVDNGNIPTDIGTVILNTAAEDETNVTTVPLADIFRDTHQFEVVSVLPGSELSAFESGSLLYINASGHTPSGTITVRGTNIAGEVGEYALHVRTNRAPQTPYDDEPPYIYGYRPLIVVNAGSSYTLDLLSPVPTVTDPENDAFALSAGIDYDEGGHIALPGEVVDGKLVIQGISPGQSSIYVNARDEHGRENEFYYDIIVTDGPYRTVDFDMSTTRVVDLGDALAGMSEAATEAIVHPAAMASNVDFDPVTRTLTVERLPGASGHDYMTVTFQDDSNPAIPPVTLTFVLSAKPLLV